MITLPCSVSAIHSSSSIISRLAASRFTWGAASASEQAATRIFTNHEPSTPPTLPFIAPAQFHWYLPLCKTNKPIHVRSLRRSHTTSIASNHDVAHSGSISSLAQLSRDNEGDSARYQYEPLQSPSHIRVLKIEPGEENDPLRCSLVQVSLDDGLDFPALSYAWGDATDLCKIECDGKITEITRNLYEALGMMRLKDVRILWADALCINQKDLVERGVQVQLMSRIYSQTDRVLLWLGREDRRIIDTALAYIDLSKSDGEEVSSFPILTQ